MTKHMMKQPTTAHAPFACFLSTRNQLDQAELMFFLTGGVGLENKRPKPQQPWVVQKMWDELCRMCDLPAFHQLKFLEVSTQPTRRGQEGR